MISIRGCLAIVIGLAFLYLAMNPELSNSSTPPPNIVIALVIFTGVTLLLLGIFSIIFVWKRHWLVRSSDPINANIFLIEEKNCESATCIAYIRHDSEAWAVGVDANRHCVRFADGKIHLGHVWIDYKKDRVIAIKLEGRHLNTLLGGEKIKVADFEKVLSCRDEQA